MYDSGYQYGQDGEWLGELLALPVDPRYHEPVTAVQFDHQYEAIWAGTESGMVYTLQSPILTRYASWSIHQSSVLDLVVLSDCGVSVSSSRVVISNHGGVTRAAANLTDQADGWVSAVVEPGTGSGRLLLAGSSGQLYTHDLITNKVTVQADGPVAGDGFTHLCGPVGHHGAVAAATAAGRVILLDSRTTWQPTSTTIAHSGGISALDVRGDLVATCGYSRRMGTVVDENCVKVFDCRSSLQPLYKVPCGCPGMLCWHPISTSTLLVASQSGMFMLTDTNNPATTENYQVDTAGDSLRCAAVSPSGECIVFGGGGGYCHLWSASMTPRVTARSRAVQLLTQPQKQSKKTAMTESGPFSSAPSPQSLLLDSAQAAGATSTAAAAAAAASTRLLSDVPDMLVINTGKPPRVIDEALKKEIKQVDFIGYIPNPHYSRSKAPGTARKAALPLQHKRIALKVDKGSADVKSSKQRRLPESGTLLPRRYRRLVIKAQSSMRFEEFDFTYYNKTKFAGLENDLPNCYCNALLQVFYFTPAFRAAILQHKPEPSLEFCLTCELLFLFKMLLNAAGGLPCQALNLLRALRQNREAAALGLLEGTVAAGGNSQGLGLGPEGGLAGVTPAGLGFSKGGAYDGVPNPNVKTLDGAGGKAREWGSSAASLAVKSGLPKRVVTLCRFLLDHLYKEAGGDSAATADSSSSSSATDHKTASSGETSYAAAAAAAAPAAATTQMPAALSHPAFRQSTRPLKKSKTGSGDDSSTDQQQPQQQDLAKVIQELFGLCYRSDMTALTGPKKGTSKSRQLRTFQVDLIYPPLSKDTHVGGSGSSRTPTPAAASPSPAGSPLLAGVSPSAVSPSSPLRAPSPGLSALPGLSLGPKAVTDRQGFGALLANSLTCEGVTKAWFDEDGGYAYVKQSRVPLELPKVLVINCAITHPSQVALWEPIKTPAAVAAATTASNPAAAAAGSMAPQQQQQQHEQPWLPWVFQVRSDPVSADVDVITADTVEDLENVTQGVSPAAVQATYELTALICQITDEAESEQAAAAAAAAKRGAGGLPGAIGTMSPGGAGSRTPGGSSSSSPGGVYQGHVVALIRVQPPYLDPNLVGGLHRFPSAADQLKSQGSGIPAAAAGSSGTGAAATLSRRLSNSSSSGGGLIRGRSGGSGPKRVGNDEAAAAAAAPAAGYVLPDDLEDVFAELEIPADRGDLDSSLAAAAGAADEEDLSEQQQQPDESSSTATALDAVTESAPSGSILRSSSSSSSKLQLTPAAAAAVHDVCVSSQQWVVINDFSISSIPRSEVLNLYNGQKLPCLVFYTQVSEVESSCQLSPPEPPSPVDADTFQTLCSAPPLQGATWRGRRNFVPLEFPCEAPRLGFMVAIDAEFVAVTRAETSFEGGVEVQLKPSRLALARVSVLRGQGPQAGTAFIDDYVMSVEPVVDYLTRWSGIKPGDLDPSTSQHYLVSLKTAYLKLHHLLDAGCVFIGHGLKQDFRMLNINVPPEQVRDTVELFSFRRQRKLSLRFLASYLLGLSIQTGAGPAGAAAAAAAAAATKASRSVLDTGAGATAAAVAAARGGLVGPGAVGGGYQGHDSIEDAATALALYNVYCKLKLEGRLEEKLHEMYRWGKTYGWEPVVHVNGVPQPPSPSAVAVGTPVK